MSLGPQVVTVTRKASATEEQTQCQQSRASSWSARDRLGRPPQRSWPAGIRVDLAEIRPEVSAVGSGITLHGNALRVLKQAGVLDEVVEAG